MLGNKEVMAKNISKYMRINNVDRTQLSKDLKVKYTNWEKDYIDRGFIFTTRFGNPLYSHKVNKLLSDAALELGINKKVTSHTFRHTHISILVEMNVSLKAIMKRIGHTDEKTTIQIYTHVTEKMDKQLTEKLENIPN